VNNNLISTATSNIYDATEFGNYIVIVSENSGCEGSREFEFSIIEPEDPFPDVAEIPNMISPNGDNINDTWVIPIKYVNGTNTEVTIMTNRGEVVLKTNNYQNNWPENQLNLTSINQVFYYIIKTSNNDIKKGTITVIK